MGWISLELQLLRCIVITCAECAVISIKTWGVAQWIMAVYDNWYLPGIHVLIPLWLSSTQYSVQQKEMYCTVPVSKNKTWSRVWVGSCSGLKEAQKVRPKDGNWPAVTYHSITVWCISWTSCGKSGLYSKVISIPRCSLTKVRLYY